MRKMQFWLLAVVLVFAFSQTSIAAEVKDKGKDCGKPEGIVISDTVQVTAKVTAIDYTKRTMTITGPEGNALLMNVDKSMKNFDNIKLGDNVVATYYESIAVFLRKPGDAPGVTETEIVKIAPKGKKPAALVVDTVKAEATIEAVNVKKRQVTLKMPDGKIKKIKVNKNVKDLDKLQKGDRIVVRMTEALAVAVKKP